MFGSLDSFLPLLELDLETAAVARLANSCLLSIGAAVESLAQSTRTELNGQSESRDQLAIETQMLSLGLRSL